MTNPRELVDEIMTAATTRFWYESELLGRCIRVGQSDVVVALAIRHQGLGNKSAGSAHVIRQTIQQIEGRELTTLWRMLDVANTDPLVEPDQPCWDPMWAAANILGEVGGSVALSEVARRVVAPHASVILTRIAAHIILRYLEIAGATAPELTIIRRPGEEGRTERLDSTGPHHTAFQRVVSDRRLANQYFDLIPPHAIDAIREHVENVSDDVLHRLLRSGNGIPAHDEGFLHLLFEQNVAEAAANSHATMFIAENLPRQTTFRDKEQFLRALEVVTKPSFARDLVISRRRSWTDRDDAPEFWIESHEVRETWHLVLELAYPGSPYPFRGRIELPSTDTLFGWSPADLVAHAEKLIWLGVVKKDDVLNVGAIDSCALSEIAGRWVVGFDANAFYEDAEWGMQNVRSMADQLRILAANRLPGQPTAI